MGKGIILGIDFSMDETQMAFLDDEGNPTSISIGTEDNFLIPTVVCYNSELNEWSAGEEAINKSGNSNKSVIVLDNENISDVITPDKYTEKNNNCILYDKLPGIFVSDIEQDKIDSIMSTFISYLLKVAVNYCNGRLIRNIVITLDEVTPSIIEGMNRIFTQLGYNEEDIKIISHSESFVYYVLNQNKDIWINKVYLLELNQYDFSCRKLNVMKGRKPHVADVSKQDLNDKLTMKMAEEDMEKADQIVAAYMEEELKNNVVSGVYLSGEGFYKEGWEKTLDVVCRNRRVFKGNNLIVKGAAYGAKEFFYTPVLGQYLISCKGRTRVKIIMSVKHKERDSEIVLSNIGDYWYQARTKAECIMAKPSRAIFEIQDIMKHENETFYIDLTDFPQRPPKTTRIEVNFRYTGENKFEIEIKDLGFGEFFKSSGISIKKEIELGK